MSIKSTVYNVTHANKIAREKEDAQKALKTMAAASAIGMTGISISSLIGGYLWRRKFRQELEEKKRKYNEKLAKLEASIESTKTVESPEVWTEVTEEDSK